MNPFSQFALLSPRRAQINEFGKLNGKKKELQADLADIEVRRKLARARTPCPPASNPQPHITLAPPLSAGSWASRRRRRA